MAAANVNSPVLPTTDMSTSIVSCPGTKVKGTEDRRVSGVKCRLLCDVGLHRDAGRGHPPQRNAMLKMKCQASVPRDVFPPTPPGPEGSNGNGLLRVQWVPGAWLFPLSHTMQVRARTVLFHKIFPGVPGCRCERPGTTHPRVMSWRTPV